MFGTFDFILPSHALRPFPLTPPAAHLFPITEAAKRLAEYGPNELMEKKKSKFMIYIQMVRFSFPVWVSTPAFANPAFLDIHLYRPSNRFALSFLRELRSLTHHIPSPPFSFTPLCQS
jgi:hypothetical protein